MAVPWLELASSLYAITTLLLVESKDAVVACVDALSYTTAELKVILEAGVPVT